MVGLAVFSALAAYQLDLPGLHYDEAKEAGVNAMQLLTCLLYTSDAADDLICVDPGGRRIIKKKKKHTPPPPPPHTTQFLPENEPHPTYRSTNEHGAQVTRAI